MLLGKLSSFAIVYFYVEGILALLLAGVPKIFLQQIYQIAPDSEGNEDKILVSWMQALHALSLAAIILLQCTRNIILLAECLPALFICGLARMARFSIFALVGHYPLAISEAIAVLLFSCILFHRIATESENNQEEDQEQHERNVSYICSIVLMHGLILIVLTGYNVSLMDQVSTDETSKKQQGLFVLLELSYLYAGLLLLSFAYGLKKNGRVFAWIFMGCLLSFWGFFMGILYGKALFFDNYIGVNALTHLAFAIIYLWFVILDCCRFLHLL